ncbi:MAG: glycosyltransferase family 39 protein, partial [Candidatus Moranbacteria bacterium]|nr:glycosyltransferase family 39 protein [Candidatus Moranbacteria bacterium]
MENLKKHAGLFASIMLGAFFLLSLSLAWQESATYDERAHIPAAYTYVDQSDMRLNTEHPPLLKNLSGFPLLFLDPSFPYDHPDWEKSGIHGQWSLGTEFLYESGNDADLILFWSRLPIILVALLLGFLIYRFTKEFAGTIAGLFALLLYVADPNVIAHSHYVTTDIGIAAALFASFIFFLRFLRNPCRKNVFLAGLFLGLAELTKFSAVLLFPIFLLFAVFYGFTKPVGSVTTIAERLRTTFHYLGKYAGIVGIAFALIYTVYAANTVTMPGEKLIEIADIKLGQPNAAARFAHSLVETTSHSAITKPISAYFLGVGMVFERVGGGNVFYFLGTVGSDADPWYFPVIFLLKETASFLILLAATGCYTIYRIGKTIAKTPTRSIAHLLAHSFQSRITQFLFGFFILFYAYISITGNLNIGFRHLFPILPFLYVLIAKTTFDFIRRRDFQGERVSR